jgi:benzodiazapine receptor
MRCPRTLLHAAHTRSRRRARDRWYRTLRKPAWTPPDWAFPVAWTALYACMGTASWLVWREGGWEQQALPLALYSAQLAFNMAWSPLFFGAHKMVRRPS